MLLRRAYRSVTFSGRQHSAEHRCCRVAALSDLAAAEDSAQRIFRVELRPLQRAAVAAALRGDSFLFVSPTGSGKSVCFQLPAVLQPAELTTLVVSPLLALMQEQTLVLRRLGIDAVELHCASGYLPGQFLASGSNVRNDAYGGSLDNRLRFIQHVIDALVSVVGAGRIGLRISPGNPYNDHIDVDPETTYAALLHMADKKGVAWVHAIRMPSTGIDSLALTRGNYSGALIGSDSFTAAEAETCIALTKVDAVSFGRLYIANPDLVARFEVGGPFNKMDKRTIYGGEGAAGYTDYPLLSGDA